MQADSSTKHLDDEATWSYREALRFYNGKREALDKDISFYSRIGVSVCKPEYMLLAGVYNKETWYIALAVGYNAFEVFYWQIPYYLPKVAWLRQERDNGTRLRVYDFERLERMITNGRFRKKKEKTGASS